MNVFRNILSALLVVIFLVSVTGFRYTRHTCLESGTVLFVMDENYRCCTDNGINCCDEVSCPGMQPEDDCCINQTYYLKAGDDYAVPSETELPKIKLRFTLDFQAALWVPEYNPETAKRAHEPPDPSSSRDLLIQHGVFLV